MQKLAAMVKKVMTIPPKMKKIAGVGAAADKKFDEVKKKLEKLKKKMPNIKKDFDKKMPKKEEKKKR